MESAEGFAIMAGGSALCAVYAADAFKRRRPIIGALFTWCSVVGLIVMGATVVVTSLQGAA